MSYIGTLCPNECKYKSGDTCVASECLYQTGNVGYEIRLNAEEINAQVKQAVKEFADKVKAKSYVNDYCREVVEIEKIDELLKEYEK